MGRWKVDADFDLGPPTHIAGESVHEWLGELLVIRSQAEDPVPSSISVVAGREDVQGTDQPIAHASFREVATLAAAFRAECRSPWMRERS